jgi:hypothetical protein
MRSCCVLPAFQIAMVDVPLWRTRGTLSCRRWRRWLGFLLFFFDRGWKRGGDIRGGRGGGVCGGRGGEFRGGRGINVLRGGRGAELLGRGAVDNVVRRDRIRRPVNGG